MTNNKVERIYGTVNGVGDLKSIFRKIRSQMNPRSLGQIVAQNDDVDSKRQALTELYRRASYLCTLSGVSGEASPVWKDKFYGKLQKMQEVASEEFTKTAQKANKLVAQGKVSGQQYDIHYG